MQINIELFYKLILLFLVCVTRHNQNTQNKKFTCLCNISRKAWGEGKGGGRRGVKLVFWLQINAKVFYKMIVSLWAYIARYARSTQSNKFAISLQYCQKCIGDEADFLPADEHKSFLQDDSITLGVYSQVCPKYPKQ